MSIQPVYKQSFDKELDLEQTFSRDFNSESLSFDLDIHAKSFKLGNHSNRKNEFNDPGLCLENTENQIEFRSYFKKRNQVKSINFNNSNCESNREPKSKELNFDFFYEVQPVSPDFLTGKIKRKELQTPEFSFRKRLEESDLSDIVKNNNFSLNYSEKKPKNLKRYQIKFEPNMARPSFPFNLPQIAKNSSRNNSRKSEKYKRSSKNYSINSSLEISTHSTVHSPVHDQGILHPINFLRKLNNFLKPPQKRHYYKDHPKIKHESRIPKDVFTPR